MKTMATALEAICGAAKASRTKRRKLRLLLDDAVGVHALVYLNHALVEHLRLDDVPGKMLGRAW